AEEVAVIAPPLERAAPALHHVRTAGAHLAVEHRDRLGLILQVRIDRAHVAPARALEAAAPPGRDAQVGRVVHRHDIRPAPGQVVDLGRRAVAAAVVHEDDLARDRALLEYTRRPLDEFGEIPLLVVARDDDAEL